MASTATTTLTPMIGDSDGFPGLEQSVSSLGSQRRHSKFSKPFKQASQYFLTRRFSDALGEIKPFITHPASKGEDGSPRNAPIAEADRKWRVKIWSFYITLQNAILDLGAEDGKAAVGIHEWNDACDKARNGTIWEQVVDVGYQGDETKVDAEVVLNLANLLLAQSPDQKRNQDYVETYLSVAPEPMSGLQDSVSSAGSIGFETDLERRRSQRPDLLRSLEVQLEIIELFALLILPQNDEWQYARDFIKMNALLDEERRDRLLHALDDMEGEGQEDSDHVVSDATPPGDRYHHNLAPFDQKLGRSDSSITVIPATTSRQKERGNQREDVTDDQVPIEQNALRPLSPRPDETPVQPPSQPLTSVGTFKPVPRIPGGGIHKETRNRGLVLWNMTSQILSNVTRGLVRNPTPLLRFVLFLMVVIGLLGRSNLRERARRLLQRSLHSISHTLGMGFKASSI